MMKTTLKENNRYLKSPWIYLILGGLFVWIWAQFIGFAMENYVQPMSDSWLDSFTVFSSTEGGEFAITFIALLWLMLWAVSENLIVSTGVLSLLVLVLAVGSKSKLIARMELLNFQDLKLTEAGTTAMKFITVDWGMPFVLLCVGLAVSVGGAVAVERLYRKEIKKLPWKWRLLVRGVACVLLGLLLVHAVKAPLNTETDYSTVQNVEGRNQFVLYRFFEKDASSFTEEGIQEAYEELLSEAEKNGIEPEASENRPNIVVIMNESWWDFSQADLSGFSMSGDPLEPLERLKKECLAGRVGVNIWGGGTVASEYEFLTGMNTRYFMVPPHSAFINAMEREPKTSMVKYMEQLGYTTVGIHPGVADFYDRKQVYEKLGFDRTVFDEDMKFTEPYTRYISDDSLVNQIIYESKQMEGTSSFVFAVSIASHIPELDYKNPYNEEYDYPIQVEDATGTLRESDVRIMRDYLNGNYYSALAYQKLIDYYKEVDEPTVVVMFGDHSPYFPEQLQQMLGVVTQSEDAIGRQQAYSTPVLFWKNFGNPLEGQDTFAEGNVGELVYKLQSYAGLPSCPMTRIWSLVSTMVGSDTLYYQSDVQGNVVDAWTEEQRNVLAKMRCIYYDYMAGSGCLTQLWDADIDE